MNEKKFNRIFNAFILVGMLLTIGVLNWFKFQSPDAKVAMQVIISIGALAGVVNTVLSANGSIWNYLFGLIDVLVAVGVSLESSIGSGNPLWGQFILHACYFLPMQFIGFAQWRKRGATSREQVKARRLTLKQWMAVVFGIAVLVVVLYFGLDLLGKGRMEFNTVILFDTIVVSLSIVGQVLMSMAFMDQWIIWITVNVFAVLLYFFKSSSSEADAYTVVYVIKYVFYFINSLNGLRIWLKLSRRENQT